MNNTPKLEMRFLLHVQLETLEHPWHATLAHVEDNSPSSSGTFEIEVDGDANSIGTYSIALN